MPLYQFKCDTCGHDEEMILSVADISSYQGTCSECRNGRLIKQLTAPGGLILDTPTWLDQSVRDAVQDPSEQRQRPIETRKDLDTWTKNKGMVAVG